MRPSAQSQKLLLSAALLSAAMLTISVSGAAMAQTRTAATEAPPTLEQRRQITRDGAIRSRITQCRAVARRVRALKTQPCADDDRLDAARNLCLPAKGRYRAYLRWDPAAGRCRPRDKYEQGSCAGSRARYHPGKRHAQDLAGSIRRPRRATARSRNG